MPFLTNAFEYEVFVNASRIPIDIERLTVTWNSNFSVLVVCPKQISRLKKNFFRYANVNIFARLRE